MAHHFRTRYGHVRHLEDDYIGRKALEVQMPGRTNRTTRDGVYGHVATPNGQSQKKTKKIQE